MPFIMLRLNFFQALRPSHWMHGNNAQAATQTQTGPVVGNAPAPRKLSAADIQRVEPAGGWLSHLSQHAQTAQASSRSLHGLYALQSHKLEAAHLALHGFGLGDSTEAKTLHAMAEQLQAARFKTDRAVQPREMTANAKLSHDVRTVIATALTRAGLPAKLAQREAKASLQQASTRLLNQRPWQTVETRLQHNGREYSCTLIPAGQMKLGAADIFPQGYDNNGVCSASTTETRHAANLWLSELKDDADQTRFKGIRHGILSPYGVEDAQQRQAGALQRATEVATAALFSQPGTLQQALAGDTVTLRLTSTALVTPGLGGESGMLRDQVGAWRALTSAPQPLTLHIKNADGELQSVRVNLEVAAFNFGVNELALKLGMGHKESDKLNLEALHQLLGPDLKPGTAPGGWVGDYLAQNPANKKQVEIMAMQLQEIWAKQSHRSDGGEPYKAAQRVAMLAFEIGAVPCWNCKSGKDRTGMLDAEIKREAIAQHQGRAPSRPGVALDPEMRELFGKVLTQGGNLEVQAYNTGAPGNKVMKQLPFGSLLNLSYARRVGDVAAWQQAQGLSTLLKS
ncbi:type III secretion system effector inositol phosphate phosphatase [Chromobacterium rhizoryzae]|uniref:Type III secretion system effector inositol phosphate phosphatase n=2 Tax=Chromobacterium rhizoryzae TaxID=1778675 RepID=A0AAD0RUL2_9NEIS|nr:type III secretion system effector inositol phosphate phosphatase [Chromobacterium rhizoryzae]